MKNQATEQHERALVLEAICTVLPQLSGNRAQGEYLLSEIEKHEWLGPYLRIAYDPLRVYDTTFHGAVPVGLMNKIFERADIPAAPAAIAGVLADPATLAFEITTAPSKPEHVGNGWTADIRYGTDKVAWCVFQQAGPMKSILTLLRRLGVTVIFPKNLRP
jgi:hypothetical protein